MAKRVFSTNINYATPTALGSAITTAQYMAIKASNAATTLCDILEISVQGANTSSAIFGGVLARCSTNETGGGTALATPNSDSAMGPNSALAATIVTFISGVTTNPTPSSTATDAKIPISINSFGGLYRENFAPTQQFQIFGSATPTQEAALFNCTGFSGAACSANVFFIYEPY
jgi:hypothetical protein